MTAPASRTGPRVELPHLPALVVGRVSHTRHRPIRHTFTYRHYQWLVDLDQPLRLPKPLRPVAQLRAADHLSGVSSAAGTPAASLAHLKAQVLTEVATAGADPAAVDRVIMLAHARILGHVFDPMSAFWCLRADGRVEAVLIEVHNTYGGRHVYALLPGQSGAAEVDKSFFVSPFNDAGGRYTIRLRLSPTRVIASVRLDRDEAPVLTAVVTGAPQPATTRQVVRTVLAMPFMTQRVSTLIRVHGIWLWLRRLPVHSAAARARRQRGLTRSGVVG